MFAQTLKSEIYTVYNLAFVITYLAEVVFSTDVAEREIVSKREKRNVCEELSF